MIELHDCFASNEADVIVSCHDLTRILPWVFAPQKQLTKWRQYRKLNVLFNIDSNLLSRAENTLSIPVAALRQEAILLAQPDWGCIFHYEYVLGIPCSVCLIIIPVQLRGRCGLSYSFIVIIVLTGLRRGWEIRCYSFPTAVIYRFLHKHHPVPIQVRNRPTMIVAAGNVVYEVYHFTIPFFTTLPCRFQ